MLDLINRYIDRWTPGSLLPKCPLWTSHSVQENYVFPSSKPATKLMALAIRFDQLIRDGVVADQAELARLGYVSRARLTQIMNLLNLVPNIQEAILDLPPVESGRSLTERELRVVVAQVDWQVQNRMWREDS